MASGTQYEFSREQNELIGGLAGKMSFVGLFLIVVGVLNLIMALLVILAIYRDRVPESWVRGLPDEVRAQAEKVPYDQLPPNNNLWAMALNAGVVGIFYLVMGVWTRSASASFRQIVDTQGRDISHLMAALGSLHKMYALVYTLLVITLILLVVALGLGLYLQFAG